MVSYTVIGDQKIHCAGCEERIKNALRRGPPYSLLQEERLSQDRDLVMSRDEG